MPKMKPVLVRWNDAHSVFPQWAETPDIDPDDFVCETVGWLLPHDTKPGYHVVVLNRGGKMVGDGIAIPDAMVVSCERLTPKQKR